MRCTQSVKASGAMDGQSMIMNTSRSIAVRPVVSKSVSKVKMGVLVEFSLECKRLNYCT